jgi:hypothetical protein
MVQSTLLAPIIINHKKQTLAELYISFNKLREKWSDDPQLRDIHFLPGANPVKFSLKQDSILGVFYGSLIKKNLSVDKIDKKLSIITISVNSENEVFSKYFTEILAKTVSDFYKEIKTKKSVQNVAILQRQTDSVRIGLNQALNGVATSVDNNPNANPALQILKVPSQRRQVDVQVNSAALTELVKNLEIAKISLRKETPLIQVIDYPILPLDVKKPGKLKSLIIGGVILAVITIISIIVRKVYTNILK